MKKAGILTLGVLFLIAGCGQATEVPPTDIKVSPTETEVLPTEIIVSATNTPQLSPTPIGPMPMGTLLDESLSLEFIHPKESMICYLRVGLNNELFTIDCQGDTIYQLLDDGSLKEYLRFPGTKIDYFNIAPDGAFWFINNYDGGLYHVDVDGQAQIVAQGMNRIFDFDSAGNLFAVDQPSTNVQRITPDGRIAEIASGFQSMRIAVAPDDSVFIVTFNSELAKVEEDGSLNIIATGFGIEDGPAFAPDGTMYVLGWNGLMRVDPSTGNVEHPGWYDRYWGIGGSLVFDQNGIGYTGHPATPHYRMNFESGTLEMIHSPYGNSPAMAVDPLTETVYVAYGDRLGQGKTSLFRVGEDGKLKKIGSVPYGIEVSITFSADGIGYLSVTDSGTTGSMSSMIYIFKPEEGTLEEFQRPDCVAQGLAVEPGTGALWWTECNALASYNADLGRRTIPYLERVNHSTIAFGADGTLYAFVWQQAQAANQPMPHGIYRYEDDGWVLLKNMTAKYAGITLGVLTMCPDGHIYVAASVEGEDIPQGMDWSSMLRLENDNSLTLIGYGLGGADPSAIACAPSGTVYFTTIDGIYSIPNLGASP